MATTIKIKALHVN